MKSLTTTADESTCNVQTSGMQLKMSFWLANASSIFSECRRTPRRYRKQNSNYWETGIKDTRSKRVRISCEGVDNQEPLDFDVDTLSAQEIKEMLKERGVKTRFRCLKKLKKQLIESFQNKENEPPKSQQ